MQYIQIMKKLTLTQDFSKIRTISSANISKTIRENMKL